jgi:hypothetical protein
MARPKKKAKAEKDDDDSSTDFSFDPGTQIELELEEACCVTGEPSKDSFSRFPDYQSGTLMVMSRSTMLKHLRAGDSVAKFKEVLVKRHGKKILDEHYSNY